MIHNELYENIKNNYLKNLDNTLDIINKNIINQNYEIIKIIKKLIDDKDNFIFSMLPNILPPIIFYYLFIKNQDNNENNELIISNNVVFLKIWEKYIDKIEKKSEDNNIFWIFKKIGINNLNERNSKENKNLFKNFIEYINSNFDKISNSQYSFVRMFLVIIFGYKVKFLNNNFNFDLNKLEFVSYHFNNFEEDVYIEIGYLLKTMLLYDQNKEVLNFLILCYCDLVYNRNLVKCLYILRYFENLGIKLGLN